MIMKKHFQEIAQRMVKAEDSFIECAMEFGEITKDQALKVLALYRKEKIVKIDIGVGQFNVKHGVFLDRDVIRRAAGVGQ